MKILIVKLSPLQEIYNAIPTVNILNKHFNAEISWAVHEFFTDVISAIPSVKYVISYPENELKSAKRKNFREQLLKEEYDLVIDLEGSMESALVCKKAKKRKEAEILGPSFQREGAHVFYTRITGNRDVNRHPIHQCMDVLKYLEIESEVIEFGLQFNIPNIKNLNKMYNIIAFDKINSKKFFPLDFCRKIIQASHLQTVIFGARDIINELDLLEDEFTTQNLCIIYSSLSIAEQAGLFQNASYSICSHISHINLLSALNKNGVLVNFSDKKNYHHPINNSCSIINADGAEEYIALNING